MHIARKEKELYKNLITYVCYKVEDIRLNVLQSENKKIS